MKRQTLVEINHLVTTFVDPFINIQFLISEMRENKLDVVAEKLEKELKVLEKIRDNIKLEIVKGVD